MQKRLRVLIADRNRYHALLVQREVEKRFPSSVTTVFHSGEAVLEELGRNHYDIGAIDCSLPVGDGTTMLAGIRRTAERLPVIMTTPPDTIQPGIDPDDGGLTAWVVKDSTFHILVPQLIEHYLHRGSLSTNGREFRPRLSLRRKADMVQVTVNTLAHEINNPLMTILGMTELILDNCSIWDSELSDRIKVIQESAKRIRSALTHLGNLDYPRVKSTASGNLIETEYPKTSAGAGN